MATETYFICPRCQVGHCRLEKGTYIKMTAKRPIFVPHVQVYVCDICNFHEYKPDIIDQVEQFLENSLRLTDDSLKPIPVVHTEIKSPRTPGQ